MFMLCDHRQQSEMVNCDARHIQLDYKIFDQLDRLLTYLFQYDLSVSLKVSGCCIY